MARKFELNLRLGKNKKPLGTQFHANNLDSLKSIVNTFISLGKGKTKDKSFVDFGNFRVTQNDISYTNKGVHLRFRTVDTIAIRTADGKLLANSALLRTLKNSSDKNRDGFRTNIQQLIEHQRKMPMVPFNAFTHAGVQLNTVKILESSGAEQLVRKITKYRKVKTKEGKTANRFGWEGYTVKEKLHFAGAILFEARDYSDNVKTFLFDVDREEIKHDIFNPFIVELPSNVDTIKAAYESLMPEAAKGRENVIRQGEWFFIPAQQPESELDSQFCDSAKRLATKWHDGKQLSLIAGSNRPNRAENGFQRESDGKVFVRGEITHAGREHRPVTLTSWYEAVPNTAVKSFTVTGDID